MKFLVLFLSVAVLLFSETRKEEIEALPIDSYPTAAAWHRLGVHDHRGIDVPLLSIVSEKSSGNGEFLDLIPMIDWLNKHRLDILRLLPLNDTAEIASPYSPISANALHPIYLSLDALPYLEEAPSFLKVALADLKKYNKTEHVEYSKVYEKKQKWLHEYVKSFSKEIQSRSDYQAFVKHTSPWLEDYALFKVLREKYGSITDKWPSEIRHADDKKIQELNAKYKEEMTCYSIIQFFCYHQMHYVHTYANERGVFLLGDMSFMVSMDSVEIWRYPHFFKLDFSLGTKPGSVVPKGENWGLPPYDWEAIERSNYSYFKIRLNTFKDYYDIYRLDHSAGYYWQYEIPVDHPPEDGQYFPEGKKAMLANGKRRLSAIASLTELLPTAEDPRFDQEMRDVIINLGIPGIRFFVYINSKVPINHLVTSGKDYNLMTITAIADHDLPPFRTWWEDNPKRAKAFARQIGWKYYKQPTVFQQEQLLWQQMHSNSLFHIELLQDMLPPNLTHSPQDERINFPGTVSDKNWSYRYKLTVEQLVNNPEVSKLIQTILSPIHPESPVSSVQHNALSFECPTDHLSGVN